jgi:predicted N-formylglutamate amidohydrolase
VSDAPFEIVRGAADAPVFLTCEHASEALPAPWSWPDGDRRLVGTHWASDLGALALARDLQRALDATLVAACFSRLLVDPNRPEDSPTLFRAEADGAPVLLNTSLDDAERERRLAGYYRPFHAAVDRELDAAPTAGIVLAVHTYTEMYEGQRRWLEAGVLFDREEALADRMLAELRAIGFHAELNEPWSGKAGLIHVAGTHADRHGRRAIEIEMRQDLAVDASWRARIVPALVRSLVP